MCQLLSREGRCKRCFSQHIGPTCHECKNFPIIYRQGALFENEEIIEKLILEKKRQQKTIAALFTWQFCRLGWPLFDLIAAEPRLRKIGKIIAKEWKKPFHQRGRLGANVNVLYLSIGDQRVDFPFSVTMGRVYHLSFFFQINSL